MSGMIAHAALAIAAAVFNGVWEGVLIVAAVWLGLRCMPRLGAATRYAIWLCALLALVLTPALTSSLSDQRPGPLVRATVTGAPIGVSISPLQSRVGASHAAAEPAGALHEPRSAPAARERSALPRRSRFAIPQVVAAIVALGWLLCVFARAFLLWVDGRALAEVRRDAWLWSSAYDYPVVLSNRVHVPLAAGFLRAAVILPAAFVEELASDDLKAIVVHEVAHLRRYDVWTNALARAAEALLVLNPAAWFVMRRLSMEREIACDDWVVARTGAGDAFAQTLAALAGCRRDRMPLAAPSAIGSRHAIVVRIERLLDSRPRRLRPSRSALGGALMVLALIALTLQAVSPVLAYAPKPDMHAPPRPALVALTGKCVVPNRSVRVAYLLGPRRYGHGAPPMNTALPGVRDAVARFGVKNVATFDLTVGAAGKPRYVTVLSAPSYPGMVEHVRRVLMTSTYEPALRNCVPVTATIRAGAPFWMRGPDTLSVVVPTYVSGWGAQHQADAASRACKIPTVVHGGVPSFPDSLKDMSVDARFNTTVRVQVNAAGEATDATVVSSSGEQAFDDAVLDVARRATYPLTMSTGFKEVLPLRRHGPPLKPYSSLDCKPLPTEYVWHTEFTHSPIP